METEDLALPEGRALPSPGPLWKSRPAIKAASFVTLLLLWWVISLLSGEEIFPGPLAVGASIAEDLVTGAGPGLHTSPYHIAVSLLRILCAFAVAMVVGSTLGVLMGVNRTCESFLDNWVMVGLTIPGLCWALIALMWFGIHDASAVFAIVMVCLPFVVVNIWEGTKAVDKQLLDMARVFSASRRLVLRKVIFPQLLPYVFAAIRYTFSVAWKIAVVAEVFGLSSGVGFMLNYWFGMFRIDKVLGWTATFTLIMLLLEAVLIKKAHARALRWRAEVTLA